MARRPTTKLSRKLFSKAPEIKPLPTGNVPSFALGKEKSITPLRSDIAGIRVKEGEDFLTFDLFKNAVRDGRIKVNKYNAYGSTRQPTKNPTLDDYYGWRKEFMDRDARRDRRADTRMVKIGRVDDPKLLRERNIKIETEGRLKGRIVSTKEIETDNEYLDEGDTPLFRGGRERYMTGGGLYRRYDESGLNEIFNRSYKNDAEYEKREKKAKEFLFERKLVDIRDENVDMPLAPYETRGMTPKQKEAFFAKERAKVRDEVKEGIYVEKPIYYSDGLRLARYDTEKLEGDEKTLPYLPFSLTDEFRKKKASALAESREGMSRAQQRKLGRVIRDGKTGPQTRTRKTPFTEDEYRNVYDVIEYKPKRYDFEDREATLEYTYGYNKALGDSLIPEQVVQNKRVVVRNKKELTDALAEMRRLTADSGLAKDIMKDFYTTYKRETYVGDDPIGEDSKIARAKYLKEGRPKNTDKEHYTDDGNWIVKYNKRYKFYGLDDDKEKRKQFKKKEEPENWWGKGRIVGSGVYHTPLQLDDRYADHDVRDKKYLKKTTGKNPILDLSDDEANAFLRSEGILKGNTFEDRKYPEPNFSHNGVKMNKSFKDDYGISGFKEVPMDSKRGFLALAEVGRTEEVMSKGMRYNKSAEDKLFVGKDGKIKARRYGGKRERTIKKVRVIRDPKKDIFGNADFVMRVGRGRGRRVFHTEEAGKKGWKQTGINKYTKQAESWKSLDVDTTPKEELQLRGLRDRRTGRGRLLGRGRLDPRRVDRSKEYKSARQEALIQMRINETAGVRDAKSKADKEIKNIRISEAQKALNLKLAKETAEKTTEGLKAKNAGLVHSYNVNVRNATAATLLGSDPIELNKILKQGGGLALIKTMIRKGEIVDASTIGQLNTSAKQKENLLRLLNEGGDFVEGQEYFFRDLDDFGRTAVRRGYLNKGGERKKNLELMKITTNDDGTSTTERFIVPKSQIVKPDDYTTTTSSGRKQGKVPRAITDFELDLFAKEAPTPKPVGEIIVVDPKTGAKSLVKSKGAGIADPSPKPQSSILSTLQTEGDFDTMGGDLELTLAPASDDSATSEEGFDFGGDAPIEPEPDTSTPYGVKPKKQPTIDEELDLLGGGEADEIAEVLGGDIPETYQQTLTTAEEEFAASEAEYEEMEKLLAEQKKKELEAALAKAEETSPEGGTTTIDEIVSPKPKKVSISDEVKELFVKEDKPVSVVPKEWSASADDVPESLLRDSWDFRGKGLKGRLDSGGAQEIPEGYIAIWTTKWAPKDNQTALVVNESDAYYLMRGLRNVKVRNDKGKSNAITDAKLKSFYRKVVEGIRDGKKQTAFNDKQLLRGLDMIEEAPEVSP